MRKMYVLLLVLVLLVSGCQTQGDNETTDSSNNDTEVINEGNGSNQQDESMGSVDNREESTDADEASGADETTGTDEHTDESLDEEIVVIRSLEDIDRFIETMTLEEKAGQLIQAERGGIQIAELQEYNIGSILSGGGSVPSNNNPEGWTEMINRYIKVSLRSSSGLPIVYGIDAVHGNSNVDDVTVFPHNIGLGAANNPELMYEIGVATGEETLACGIHWNFAPAVSSVQDIRWGRSYESYSEQIDRVALLAPEYIKGLQSTGVMATTKHFIGDGQTTFGTGEGSNLIDRGDVTVSMDEIKRINLKAYEVAIEADTKSIMASFNSIHGAKVHGDQSILTDLLRDELGFEGLVVSDWEAIHTIAPTLEEQVALAINAGVDLLMQPYNWKDVHEAIVNNVNKGTITEARLNEAVRRNLVFKFEAGLFEDEPYRDAGEVGTVDHKAIARQAVAESMVLLENDGILPLNKSMKIFLTGPAADNVGIQSGGWTREWQGSMDPDLNNGTSLKDALVSVLTENGGSLVETAEEADVILLAIGEKPYTEMFGDSDDLSLSGPTALEGNLEAVQLAKDSGKPVVTVIIAGRPLMIDEYIRDWNAVAMAWLPGTEGSGMTDVLFGDVGFTGTLPVSWPKRTEDADVSVMMEDYDSQDLQYPYDYGLTY